MNNGDLGIKGYDDREKTNRIMKTFSFNQDAIKQLYTKYKSTFEEHISYLKIKEFELVLEKIFWASLKPEEGKFHNFSVSITPSHLSALYSKLFTSFNYYGFDVDNTEKSPYFLSPESNSEQNKNSKFSLQRLSKLAPAFENNGSVLCVWCNENEKPYIHGVDDNFSIDFLIKTLSPGKLLLHFNFSNTSTAIFSGSEVKFINHYNIFSDFFGNEPKKEFLIQQIADKIRIHQHGGTLIILKDKADLEEKSVENNYAPKNDYVYLKCSFKKYNFIPENYFTKDFSSQTEVDNEDNEKLLSDSKRDEEIYIRNKIVNFVSQLTAIDGATIITADFEILGFGAKLKPITKINDDNCKTEVSEPFEDDNCKTEVSEPFEVKNPSSKDFLSQHGTRHKSAAQFIFDNKENALAIVASQDGKISIMFWSNGVIKIVQHAEYLFTNRF